MSVPYHWVLTIQLSGGPGATQLVYTHGAITPAPGETRSDLFRQLFEQATAQGAHPGFHSPVPLFFSLEPEDL